MSKKPSDNDIIRAHEKLHREYLALMAKSRGTPAFKPVIHKVGCMCVGCIEVRKGPAHKPMCMCDICVDVRIDAIIKEKV